MDNIEEIMKFEKDHAPDKPLYARATRADLDHAFADNHICRVYGIYDEEKLVALGAYQSQGDEYSSREEGIYEICGIVVHSLYRGRGLGTKMVNTVRNEIRNNQKYKEIYLTVSPLHVAALVLYLKNGFIVSDDRRDKLIESIYRVRE